jgi:hypothetical protein
MASEFVHGHYSYNGAGSSGFYSLIGGFGRAKVLHLIFPNPAMQNGKTRIDPCKGGLILTFVARRKMSGVPSPLEDAVLLERGAAWFMNLMP